MSPEWPIVALVLLAALLHASWNAIAKSSGDPLLGMWLVVVSSGAIAGAGIFVVDVPHRDAWPFLAASVALHFAYELFLVSAYRHGDLSQVYPIARGLAPCVVALWAALFASEVLGARQWLGLALASGSIASLAWAGAAPGRSLHRGVRAALVTALLIGSYTFVDAQGVRRCHSPFDYIAWTFALDAIPLTLLVLVTRRRELPAFLRARGARGALGGAMAAAGYAIVLYAMARSPMAGIAALRETSVIFAALIGTRLLGEPFGGRRVVAAAGLAAGVVLLRA